MPREGMPNFGRILLRLVLMRPLRLHTKTALLVSAITLAMFLATQLVVSVRMVNLVRQDEQELARLQAIAVAEQISLMPPPHKKEDLARAIAQARGARPNVVAVRLWERTGDSFVERLAAGSGPAEALSTNIQAELRRGPASRVVNRIQTTIVSGREETRFRVFAPITDRARISGAVEVVERVDEVPYIVQRVAQTASLLALAAIGLTMLAIYLLFRYLVYLPMNDLDEAMSRVKSGSLDVQVPVSTQDEFGRLATGFNRMIERIRELTETARLRSQRLESLGTLAAGIAHDLNNILSPLSVSTFLLRSKVSDPNARQTLDTMDEVIERGGQLVKQVLSFARGVEGERISVDPGQVLAEVAGILKETFPKSIKIKLNGAGDSWSVFANPTQLHQVLMNLFVNARDAMPEGGELEIATENIRLDEHDARLLPDAKPGNYVVISVRDTGIGISLEVIDKIFDPFFTTKEQGKGTGLGLSTSLGIVRSHGGFIKVYSQPGSGTLFKVYLPALDAGTKASVREEQPEPPAGKGELILVADDEEPIRRTTRGMLEAFNYRVVTAADGHEACALYHEKRGEISAVLTDMMMPVMDGAAVIKELTRLDPQLPIIASSGLAEAGREEQARSLGACVFLSKPYTAPRLLWALHELLRDGQTDSENEADR